MPPILFGESTLPRLPVLLESVRRGELQIPAFQRRYLWGDDQRIKLFDSIARSLPIGSLLVWRSQQHPGMMRAAPPEPFSWPPPSGAAVHNYLLDGAQRLTTLHCAFCPTPEEGVEDAEGNRWPLVCELDGDGPLRFGVLPRRRRPTPTQVPLWKVLDDNEFDQVRSGLPTPHLKARLRALETRLRDYMIPLLPLLTEDLELVKETFVRVNSMGSGVSEVAMVRAFTWSEQFDVEQRLEAVRDAMGDSPWRLLSDDQLLGVIKAVLEFDLYRADPRVIGKALVGRHVTLLDTLPGLLLDAGRRLEAIGVYGPGALPYAYLFAGLCRALARGGMAPAEELLRRWFFFHAYAESLSGATSAQIYRVMDQLLDPMAELPTVRVGPVLRVSATSVRGRLALLSLARAGGPHLERFLGEQGTNAALSLRGKPGPLAERLIGDESTRQHLRKLVLQQHGGLFSNDGPLLREHLFIEEGETRWGDPDVERVLARRGARIQAAERRFVEALGLTWEED